MPFSRDPQEFEYLKEKILSLKEKRNAVILAHNYQIEEVQEIADYVGDSFGLSQQATLCNEEVVVFCGVHFMAESAAILAPEKTVLLPEPLAGCPLADTITAEELREAKARNPEAAVVCYVNSSAEVKAESDICCTSSNAVQVVNSVKQRHVLFVPDANLAHWVSRFTNKEIIPWRGNCITHHRISAGEVAAARRAYPDAKIAVHPECKPEVTEQADFVGSTSQIIRFASETDAKTVIIGTEMGVLPKIKKENPDKKIFLLSPKLICYNMKLTTLDKVYSSLSKMEPVISVLPEIRAKAAEALSRMLDVK